MNRPLAGVICALLAWVLMSTIAVRAGAMRTDLMAVAQSQEKADPTKNSKNMDEVVAFPMDKVLDAARQALQTYGCEVDPKKEKPGYLECKRKQHAGAFVGSGGEKLVVTLTAKGEETRVEVKTVKGFVGMAGMKNWSTPVFDEMMKILKGA